MKKPCIFCSIDLADEIHFSRVLCGRCRIIAIEKSPMCFKCYCEQEKIHMEQEHGPIDLTGDNLWIG